MLKCFADLRQRREVSEEQHRMVKNYSVLDFTGANTADLILHVIPELNRTLEKVTKVRRIRNRSLSFARSRDRTCCE